MITVFELKQIWYLNTNNRILGIYFKLFIITILYYLLYIIKRFYKLWLIEDYTIYILSFLNIICLLYRLAMAYSNYFQCLKNVDIICNKIIMMFMTYSISYQFNDEEHIDDLEDEDLDTYVQNKIVSQNYHYQYHIDINNSNNLNNNSNTGIDIKEIKQNNLLKLKNILLFYLTYVFKIYKIKHNNFNLVSNIKFKSYEDYDKFINTNIEELYYNFNIDIYDFKIKYIEQDIYDLIYTGYLNNNINAINYKNLLNIFNEIQTKINFIYSNLNINNEIKLITYISNFLLYLNILLLYTYYLNYLPYIGIFYILIISYVYLFIEHTINILLNYFNNLDINNDKSLGINLDIKLHDIYDKIYILFNLNLKNIKYSFN